MFIKECDVPSHQAFAVTIGTSDSGGITLKMHSNTNHTGRNNGGRNFGKGVSYYKNNNRNNNRRISNN